LAFYQPKSLRGLAATQTNDGRLKKEAVGVNSSQEPVDMSSFQCQKCRMLWHMLPDDLFAYVPHRIEAGIDSELK